jgi:hypothetical protein
MTVGPSGPFRPDPMVADFACPTLPRCPGEAFTP